MITNVLEVAEKLKPLSELLRAMVKGEENPSGQWFQAWEAYCVLWTCFEDNALKPGSTWTIPKGG